MKQLDLSRMLAAELREIGLEDVELSEHGYVYATLPGTPGAPVIGLIAHVDTSPESPGCERHPDHHESYDGEPIVLPGDPTQVLDPAQEPALAARLGHDIITSDGTTLLGADDKAGVAEIMTAVAYLREAAPEPRATVRVGFTVDEEVGRGADHFDIEGFGADCRLHARRLWDRRDRDRVVLGPPAEGDHRWERRASGHGEGQARERGQACRRLRRCAAARRPLARDDRGS